MLIRRFRLREDCFVFLPGVIRRMGVLTLHGKYPALPEALSAPGREKRKKQAGSVSGAAGSVNPAVPGCFVFGNPFVSMGVNIFL